MPTKTATNVQSYWCVNIIIIIIIIIIIDFISRGNILNNKVNLSYDPQTITIATKHKKLLKVKKSDPRSGVLTKQVYMYIYSQCVIIT